MKKDEFDDALNRNPMRVVKLSWILASTISGLFVIIGSGYLFWDSKLVSVKADMQRQIDEIKIQSSTMNTTLNVVDTKVNYIQRDLDDIKKNLNDYILSENKSKKNRNDFTQTEFAQK